MGGRVGDRLEWNESKRRKRMYNIFYIIGLVVVVLAVFGYFRIG
jgi:predicted nucleic acid-binding Zn ribbon protein